MTDVKKGTAGGIPAAGTDNEGEPVVMPDNITAGGNSQAPPASLNLALDEALGAEDLHHRAAANLFTRARELALLALMHAQAAHRARRERAILERGILL